MLPGPDLRRKAEAWIDDPRNAVRLEGIVTRCRNLNVREPVRRAAIVHAVLIRVGVILPLADVIACFDARPGSYLVRQWAGVIDGLFCPDGPPAPPRAKPEPEIDVE